MLDSVFIFMLLCRRRRLNPSIIARGTIKWQKKRATVTVALLVHIIQRG